MPRAPGRLRLSALWAAPLLTDLFVTALAGAYRPALRPARARSAKKGASQPRNHNSFYWL